MKLTSGEKAVWAATYAYQRGSGHGIVDAVRMAWGAVRELRNFHSEVDAAFGYGEVREMYDAVLGREPYDYS